MTYLRNSSGQFCVKDDIKYHKGYRVIYKPEHHHARHNGYVYEHILIMEEMLGRSLNENEVVHHIDGNKLNNNRDNLMLFPNNAEHMKYHWKSKIEKYELSSGQKLTIQELADKAGVSYMTAYQRLKKLHWTPDEVLLGRIAEEMRNNAG